MSLQPSVHPPIRLSVLSAALLLFAGTHHPGSPHPLAGTWTLVTAYEIQPDGSRTQNYGADAQGLLIVDDSGRYSLQIFRPGRPRFASGDKTRGTADEYQAAVLGMSSHVGRCGVDSAAGILRFRIEQASYPNWEGTEQRRTYRLSGDTLTYQVPASASGSGTIAVSSWRRVSGASRLAEAQGNTFINPPGLSKPNGYAHVVIAADGRTVYVAGQIALDSLGQLVGAGDFRAQAERVFENLRIALAVAGAGFADVVKTTTYITDVRNVPVLREVRARYLDAAHPPANTMVPVVTLARPDLLIEIEVVAVRERP